MAKQINRIARALGATVIGTVAKTGGGSFGAARLGTIVAGLQDSSAQGRRKRRGRPTRTKSN